MSQALPVVHLVDDDASFLKAISRLLRASPFSVEMDPGWGARRSCPRKEALASFTEL